MIMRELTYRAPGTYRQRAQLYPQAAERATARTSLTTLAPQICGVQYSIPNAFLIDRLKRLETAATHRKQSSRVISNRMKKRGSYDARLAEFRNVPAGSGLRGMRERAKQLGGNPAIRSNGKGTTVIATVPFVESRNGDGESVSKPPGGSSRRQTNSPSQSSWHVLDQLPETARHALPPIQAKEHMSYVESNLVPGETVIYQTRLHWIVMLGHMIVGIFLLALPGAVLLYYAFAHTEIDPRTLQIMKIGGIALIVGGGGAILVGMVRRSATEMAVTNRRVVIKTGLASRKTIEMMLNKVESIEVSEPAAGRMLGYGSIVVIGTGGTPEPFHKMAHPLEFRSQVQQQIEKLPR